MSADELDELLLRLRALELLLLEELVLILLPDEEDVVVVVVLDPREVTTVPDRMLVLLLPLPANPCKARPFREATFPELPLELPLEELPLLPLLLPAR